MKKYIIIPLLVIMGFFSLGSFVDTVNAASINGDLKVEFQSNIYYTRRGGGQDYLSAKYAIYSMNNEVVYCIEPGIDVTTHLYTGADGFVNSPYGVEVNSKIQLIGHYGYEYPGHQTTRYRMATQALIWEVTGGQIVEYWTEQYGNGSHIDVSYEKNEIMKLVNSHYDKPSFNASNITGYINQEIVVEDTKGILNQFEIYNANGNVVRKEGNKLYITPKKIGKTDITLIRPKYDNSTTIVFIGSNNDSQKMGKFRASDPVVANININVLGGKLTIEKIDSDNNNATPQGDGILSGAVYGIYDENDTLLTKITTGNDGKVTSDYLNKIGKLKLKEITASKGYMLDQTVYNFEINEDNLNPVIKVKETIIKKDIKLFKVFASDETGILTGEPNISFDIYLKSKNTLYKTITTDNKGYATATLPYGTYIIKQKNTTPDYEKLEDFEIVVNEKSENEIYKLLSNASIKAKLKVIKVDSETGKSIPIAGIKFKIKNLDTNEYVCQTITYPSAEKVCIFETDKNGVLITPSDMFGNYQLEEVEEQLIEGYLWNSTPLKFHIGERSNFIVDKDYGALLVVNFENTRVKGKIELNKIGEKLEIKNGSYSYEKIPLENVKYGLYANEDIYINNVLKHKKDELIKTVITDEKGYTAIDDLELGKYYVLELESSSDNLIDKTKYSFELSYKDQYTKLIIKDLNLKNYLPKGKLEFTKTDIATGKPIPNTLIEVYHQIDEDSEPTLIFSDYTDELGNIIIDNLFVGKFFIIEKESAEGYYKTDEKVYFEITEDGQIVRANLTNEQIVEVPNTLIEESKLIPIVSISLMIIGTGVVVYATKNRKKK